MSGVFNHRVVPSLLVLAGVCFPTAYAADIIVTSAADPGVAGDGQCTVREAIANANSNADVTAGDCAGGSGDDSISFASSVGPSITLMPNPGAVLRITDATGSLDILGPGADRLTIDGANAVGIFEVGTFSDPLPAATIDGLTLRRGGGFQGGAIKNYGVLTLRRSVVRESGGGDDGGGIFNLGTLTVLESTVANNGEVEDGGGIWSNGTLTVVNSTISGNRTRGPFGGGGIRNSTGGVAALFNTTVTANVSEQTVPSFESRGGGIEHVGASFLIANSIVAGNSAPGFPESGDCSGAIASSGYNVIGVGCAGGGPGDQTLLPADVARYIDPLADNGGPTPTHALVAVSDNPAMDLGDPSGCRAADGSTLTSDQRGSPRPSAARCDIGSYELQQVFPFHGFYPLIADPPALNKRLAGGPVVMSFSLGGNRGLNIFAAGSPSSRRIDCATLAPLGASEPTATVAGIPLQYLAPTDSYVYLWQTKRAWANTCREFSVSLVDHTTHTALFRFK
jgi:hypothetical protein